MLSRDLDALVRVLPCLKQLGLSIHPLRVPLEKRRGFGTRLSKGVCEFASLVFGEDPPTSPETGAGLGRDQP